MELELRSEEVQGGHEIGGRALGGARPLSRGQVVGPLAFIFCQYFLYFPKVISVDFQVIPRTFVFYTINNTMAVLLKTTSVRVNSFKSCKLESKTRSKVFGKVDTLETYERPTE